MFSKKELSRFAIVIVVIVFLLILYLVTDVFRQKAVVGQINSFEECVEAGYGTLEIFPEKCITPNGRSFTKEYPPEVLEELNQIQGNSSPDESEPQSWQDEDRSPGAYDGCVITGCSSQVCAEEEIATTCEFRPEYACYDSAICERQASGECGWTQTSESQSCLIQF